MAIYSETWGRGPDMVILHGWGFHSQIMRPFAEILAENFRITLIDLPGFGRSMEENKNDSVHTVVEAILEVAPAAGIFLGWSLGGLIAMQMACAYPERIRGLIAVASSPYFMAAEGWPGMDVATFKLFLADIEHQSEKTLYAFSLLQVKGTADYRSAYQSLKQQLFAFGKPSQISLCQSLKILQNTDLRNAIKQIQCPMQFILGQEDQLIPIAIKEKIKLLAPSADIAVIEHSGHVPFLFHAQETLNHIHRRFLC